MKRTRATIIMALLLTAGFVFAESANETLEAMAKGRLAGVTNVKKNPDGSIKSLLIIGRAPLNKLLDDDEAEADAKEDAAINANESFAEYLNKTVTVSRSRGTSTGTMSSGTEKDGAVSKSGNATKISAKSKEFSSISKAALAGMKEIYAGVFNNKFVIIYAWDKAECKQLKDVIFTMSETAQTAIKEAKDAESRLAAPTGTSQQPVPARDKRPNGGRRTSNPIQEGGNASSDAGDYL